MNDKVTDRADKFYKIGSIGSCIFTFPLPDREHQSSRNGHENDHVVQRPKENFMD